MSLASNQVQYNNAGHSLDTFGLVNSAQLNSSSAPNLMSNGFNNVVPPQFYQASAEMLTSEVGNRDGDFLSGNGTDQ